MRILSINVGLPRLVMRNDEPVSTGIFKEPVAGRVILRTLNLDGDRQSDLSVHGGPGDEVVLVQKNASGVRVVDVTRLYSSDKQNVDLMRQAIATDGMPADWRDYFEERLEARGAGKPRS